jgi:hypothetical protein
LAPKEAAKGGGSDSEGEDGVTPEEEGEGGDDEETYAKTAPRPPEGSREGKPATPRRRVLNVRLKSAPAGRHVEL